MNVSRKKLGVEILRKGIHVTTGIVPLVYLLTDSRSLILWVLGLFTVGMLLIEWLRRSRLALGRLFIRMFGFMLRLHELSHAPLGATHYCAASFLCVLLFPKPIAVTAMFFLAIGDTAASLIGMAFGRRQVGQKTVEGAVAFWVASSVVAILCYLGVSGYPLIAALLAAPIAALAELLLQKIDDNWVIPLTTGMAMSAFVWTGSVLV